MWLLFLLFGFSEVRLLGMRKIASKHQHVALYPNIVEIKKID